MYGKSLESRAVESREMAITKEERYELIAQIAQGLNEYKDSQSSEEQQIWDSGDTDLNFDALVSRFS